MKITILTAGTRGDVQPFIALGLELKKLGSEVTVVSSVTFENLVKSYGLEYRMTRGDISKIMQSGELDKAANADNPIKALSILRDKKFMSRLIDVQEDFYNACDDAEVIIYHPGAAIGHMIAKEKGIVSILGSPFPLIETNEYPSILFYQKRIPKILNRLTHKFFKQGFWMATKKPIELFYKDRLSKLVLLENSLKSKDLKLISCSQNIFKTPQPAFASGYWFLDESDGYIPEASLTEFLSKGDKPIYIGFGSIGNGQFAEEKTKIIISAIQKTNSRAVIATGFGGLSEITDLPENIYILKEAPHAWLFPKMSMAIHHGGAGTTAEGFRAGIPMIIVPHGNDQFAWGKRVFELGVGANPINIKKLSVEKLVNAIEYARSKNITENVKQLSRIIQNENGAKKTAKFVMDYINIRQQRKTKIGAFKETKFIFNEFKNLILIKLSIPIILGIIIGGVYLGLQILKGLTFDAALNNLLNLERMIRPFAGFLIIIVFLVFGFNIFRKLKNYRENS